MKPPQAQSTESLWRSILAIVPDAMVVIDEAGNILSFSYAADKMFDLVTISLEDNGAGISEGVVGQLFQPFASMKQAGLGIGRSICSDIIEAHGGRILFEPSPGGGRLPSASPFRRWRATYE